MRRRIAVLGATDDAIAALPRLASDPDVELVCVFDADALAVRRRLALHDPQAAALLQKLLTDDPAALEGLELVSGASVGGRDEAAAPDAKAELAEALREIADAVALVADRDALFARVLDLAIAATRAGGGSLLLVDAAGEALRVAAAVGLERELWSKVALRIGDGIAGRAWAERRPLVVRGRADAAHFEIARERHDVAISACTPLVVGADVRGVLCLHHASRTELFGAEDLEALEAIGAQLGRVAALADAQRNARATALASAIAADVQAALAEPGPLEARLAALCRVAAAHGGGGIATLWWNAEGGGPALRQAATSLPGGALGAAACLAPGAGIDGRAARERTAVFVPRDGRLAYAALPLLDGPTLIGVLSIQLGADAATDEAALRALADGAARALARDRALADVRRRAERAEVVHEAALRLLAERDPDRLAEQLASAAALALDAEQVVVRLLDPERRSFRVRARAGDGGVLDEAIAELDRRGAREALRTRAPVAASADCGNARAWLVVPIASADRLLGTLGLYDKRPPAPPDFDTLDRETAQRLAGYAARALATAPAAEQRSRLLAPAAFAQRLDEEIARARAAASGTSFALVTCRIENAEPLGGALDEALQRVGAALAAQLRAFDVAGETARDTLAALLPEPGGAPAERIARLARALTESVGAATPAIALAFGYAIHRNGETSRAALLASAAEIRIRTL
jgi:GAF domain-containing protein